MVHSLVGPRIRERRRTRKISQAQLASDVGISASYLNLIEHNKRGIGGSVLNAIARQLDTTPAELTEGVDAFMIDTLTEAASAASAAGAELERMNELIGRFPGWARVIGALVQRAEAQERRLSLLSDRLAHDPHLAEAMHLMLSSITAVHATAGILEENPQMADAQRRRFTSNLYLESQRLTDTANNLVAYFDNPQERRIGEEEAADNLYDFWAKRDFHAAELERPAADLSAFLSDMEGIAPEDAEASVARYAEIASALPLATFLPHAARLGWDPLSLAQATGSPLGDIFHRLAHLPSESGAPAFGLIQCDASGGVLFRKETPGFSLPRLGGACPLWPLYRAFSQPGQAIRAVLRTPNDESFIAWAIVTPEAPSDYGLPPTCRSAMLFTADSRLTPAEGGTPAIDVGVQCRICPRETCPSRRAAFLLK